MKIDNNINYLSLVSQYKPKYGLEHRENGELRESKNVNRGYYGGSSVSFGSAAKLYNSRWFNKLLDACDNPTIVQNLVALVLALGLRPLAIMTTPGGNKEDKIYASGHSMASGLIGFVFTSILMTPLGTAFKKYHDNEIMKVNDKLDKSDDIKYVTRSLAKLKKEGYKPEDLDAENLLDNTKLEPEFLKDFGEVERDEKGHITRLKSITKSEKEINDFYENYKLNNLTKDKLLEGTKLIKKKGLDIFADFTDDGKFLKRNKVADLKSMYKAVNMLPDVLVFGVLKAMLTIAMIPPILKYVFGVEKSKPAQPKQPAQQPANGQPANQESAKVEGGSK